jgi:hypothetical protein
MLEPAEGLEPSSAQLSSRATDHGMAVGVDEADQVGLPEPQLPSKLDVRDPVLGPQPAEVTHRCAQHVGRAFNVKQGVATLLQFGLIGRPFRSHYVSIFCCFSPGCAAGDMYMCGA